MTAVYVGEKRCEITHGPSGAEISTDAPKDNHGRGEAFSPTDLMAASLGVCMLTVMGIQADLKNWNIIGSKVKVMKEMVTNPRRIGKLTAHLEMPNHLSSEARAHLENTALNCPVKCSLSSDIKLDIQFKYA